MLVRFLEFVAEARGAELSSEVVIPLRVSLHHKKRSHQPKSFCAVRIICVVRRGVERLPAHAFRLIADEEREVGSVANAGSAVARVVAVGEGHRCERAARCEHLLRE